jgi:hypothetical protein
VNTSIISVQLIECGRSWVQTKDYKIGICCFSAKHTTLRRKNKDWLGRNQNNVSRVERHVYLQTVVLVS